MNKMRPIQIFWQNGVTKRQIRIAAGATKKVLQAAGMDEKIAIYSGGEIEDPVLHREDNVKSPFFGHYDALEMMNGLYFKQEIDNFDEYYAVLLMRSKLFINVNGIGKAVNGLARDSAAAIVYVGYDSLEKMDKFKMLYTHLNIVHEDGHIFDLPSLIRKGQIILSSVNDTRHCANKCIMFPNLQESAEYHDFCPTCLRELQEYFK